MFSCETRESCVYSFPIAGALFYLSTVSRNIVEITILFKAILFKILGALELGSLLCRLQVVLNCMELMVDFAEI